MRLGKKQRRLFWFRGVNSRNSSLEILERKGVCCKAKGPVIRFLQESTICHSFSPFLCVCACVVVMVLQFWFCSYYGID